MVAFPSYVRFRPVTGEDACIGGQGENLVTDAGEFLHHVSAQVGTAQTPPEECVSAEEHLMVGLVQADAAGSVAGSVDDMQAYLPQFHHIAFAEWFAQGWQRQV